MLTGILVPISGAFILSILITVIILHALGERDDDYEEDEDGNDEH